MVDLEKLPERTLPQASPLAYLLGLEDVEKHGVNITKDVQKLGCVPEPLFHFYFCTEQRACLISACFHLISSSFHNIKVTGHRELAPRATKLGLARLSQTKRISLQFLGVALLGGALHRLN